jgi:hypothetical protein
MNQQISEAQFTNENVEDEISLIDILLFLKSSINNIAISIIGCLVIGASYYLFVPKVYEATANIQMAQVASNSVESPSVLLAKIQLPLYFSQKAWEACGTNEQTTPSKKLAEKIKPVLNKSAPFIAFTVQGNSTQEAKECLNAVIADIQIKQAEIAKPILAQKKIQLEQLNEKLKLAEETSKVFAPTKLTENFPDSQFASRALILSTTLGNAREIKDLRNTINDIEVSLLEPHTKSTFLPTPMYAPEVATNKRPIFTIGICLMLGIFFGLLITGIARALPTLSKQLKNAKAIKPTDI